MSGMYNEYTYFNGVQESVADILKHNDDLGGPMSYAHMSAGWAVAGDTPFTWTKQIGSDFGGNRPGVIVHWPKRVEGARARRQGDGPLRVRLRRGRAREGRTRHDLRERQEGRRGTHRAHAADDLLRRRDGRRKRGRRDAGDRGLQEGRQRVHREDPQGHDRGGRDRAGTKAEVAKAGAESAAKQAAVTN